MKFRSPVGGSMPVSRFWACVFANGLFALCWTQKMKKTRKWILIYSTYFIILFSIISGSAIYNTVNTFDESISNEIILNKVIETGVIPKNFSPDIAEITVIILFSFLVLVSYTLPIYFMLRWTTQYNLENFGYKSKKEWSKKK